MKFRRYEKGGSFRYLIERDDLDFVYIAESKGRPARLVVFEGGRAEADLTEGSFVPGEFENVAIPLEFQDIIDG